MQLPVFRVARGAGAIQNASTPRCARARLERRRWHRPGHCGIVRALNPSSTSLVSPHGPRVRGRSGAGRRVAPTLLVVALLAGGATAAVPPGTPRSREALALCNRAQDAPAGKRPAMLTRSLALADEAVAADDQDALAHFARFCALGEQARLAGASVMNLLKLRPIRQAVDRTLALAPDFAPALLGKGAFLLNVPWPLGGDAAEGERLVRRALAVDPNYFGARLRLAETLADQGKKAEARTEAQRALEIAEREHDAGDAAEARRLLATLGD
jgi:tetratricopeptide (TPR) repeat protein